MFAHVHDIEFPDIDWAGLKSDDDTHAIQVDILVGPEDGGSSHAFTLWVCTQASLERRLQRSPIFAGRHYLFVQEFRPTEIKRFLREEIEAMQAESWDHLLVKIAGLAQWEGEALL